MDNFRELMGALTELEKNKGVSKEVILEALEVALVSAYKKNYPDSEKVTVTIDRETGKIRIVNEITVVSEYSGDGDEMLIEEALELDKNYQIGDVIQKEVEVKDFGRIAAQSAKQIVVQRIRQAQRNSVFEAFVGRETEIITGTIQRIGKSNIFVELGKIEGVLLKSEQVPTENYKVNDKIKAYILSVNMTTKGPQIFLSRANEGLVKRLFELEVPEIRDGIVEIKSISREAGYRTKIAVAATNQNVDPLGACVGQRGVRVQAIVDELNGEKIDIIEYCEDPAKYISNALSPSDVIEVKILDEETKSALVIVPDDQLSLAIGKEGQNARLAARLTSWKIDIKSQSQYKEMSDEEGTD